MVFRQSSHNKSHWAQGWLGVVVFILFGIALLSMVAASEDSDLSPENVSVAVGHVAQIRTSRGSVYFKLMEPQLAFVHHSKGGHSGTVESALQGAGVGLVRVQYDNSNTNTPLFGSERHYSVLDLYIAGQPVLTASQIRDAHTQDNLVGFIVGTLFLALGVIRGGWLWLRQAG